MTTVDTSLGAIGVALAIPPLVQVCLTLGTSAVQVFKDYHDSDSIAAELALKIDCKWRNLQKILRNIDQLSVKLDVDLEVEIRPILEKLRQLLIETRAKAARLGMTDQTNELQRINPLSKHKLRAAAIAWSKKDLQRFLLQCEEWEVMISSRLAVIILFESRLLSGANAWTSPVPRLNDISRSAGNIRSNWSEDVEEITVPLKDSRSVAIPRATVQCLTIPNGCTYLVEKFQYVYGIGEEAESKEFKHFQTCLINTARMLRGAEPSLMNILRSPGIYQDRTQGAQFTLLYSVPSELYRPRSLRDLLMSPEARNKTDGSLLISLNDRIRLATSIATAVLYVHSGRFVHKQIKPENLILFASAEMNSKSFPESMGRPFLVGFDASRAESGSTTKEGETIMEDSVYQHPDRWGVKAKQRFTMVHDIYSLGVVLLEIGIWKSFVRWRSRTAERHISWSGFDGLFDSDGFVEGRAPTDVSSRLIEKAAVFLPPRVGQRYTNVVLSCLSGEIEEGLDSKDEFEARIGLSYIKNVLSRLEMLCI
jgi:hypothetical protein